MFFSVALLSLLLLFGSHNVAAHTGLHGADDLQHFVTRPDLMPPKWNITLHKRYKEASAGYWFLAPYQFSNNHLDDVKWVPSQVGPMVFDQTGELVWSGASLFENRVVFDFGVTELDGKLVLQGIMSHAQPLFSDGECEQCGAGFFLNSSIELQHSLLVTEWNDELNQHEFNVKGNSTLVITHGRKKLRADDLGFEGEKIWTRTDGFQELNTQTGEVLFEWITKDHVSLIESSFYGPNNTDRPDPDDYTRGQAWDAFHANSVDRTAEGDYLFSIRHLDTIVLISGKDGHIIWHLCGKKNDFNIEISAVFSRQHHARFVEHSVDRSVISLMDNAVGGTGEDSQLPTSSRSRGLILELKHPPANRSAWNAVPLKQYHRPDGGYADRRGSLQRLPNGNVFMGWTDSGYFSEHADDGTVLMEARWLNDSNKLDTYRAYKFDGWRGYPKTKPDARAFGYAGDTLVMCVSWNGATEVVKWKVLSVADEAETYKANKESKVLGTVEKTGFETIFATHRYPHQLRNHKIQVKALNVNGNILGTSEPVEIEIEAASEVYGPGSFEAMSTADWVVFCFVVICSALGCVVLAIWVVLRMRERRHDKVSMVGTEQAYQDVPLEDGEAIK